MPRGAISEHVRERRRCDRSTTKEAEVGAEDWASVERYVLLRTIDSLWVEHLTELDDMRRGIGLRGYSQQDPLNEFRKEAFGLYEELRGLIRHRSPARSSASRSRARSRSRAVGPSVRDAGARPAGAPGRGAHRLGGARRGRDGPVRDAAAAARSAAGPRRHRGHRGTVALGDGGGVAGAQQARPGYTPLARRSAATMRAGADLGTSTRSATAARRSDAASDPS